MIEKIVQFKVICDSCGKHTLLHSTYDDLAGIINKVGWIYSLDGDGEISVTLCKDCKKNIPIQKAG